MMFLEGAVVQQLEGRWFESLAPPAAYLSTLEQDAEPWSDPDERPAPCMAASTISVWMSSVCPTES